MTDAGRTFEPLSQRLGEPGRILSIYHININVQSLERSREFYEMLGFRVVARFEEKSASLDRGLGFPESDVRTNTAALFMKLGNGRNETVLDLAEWRWPRSISPAPSITNIGIPRIALRVDDIEAIVAKLKTRGITFFSDPQTISTLERKPRFACFKDPDGVILELVQV
jgi:catechol 2,3-dioxygenase-like lactoylglutathione lyase family enzyme